MGIWEMKREESLLSLPALFLLTYRYKFAGQKKLSRFLWPEICLLNKNLHGKNPASEAFKIKQNP